MKCDYCPEPAEFNFQDLWVVYRIKNGEYIEHSAENVGDNLHLCLDCAEREGYI